MKKTVIYDRLPIFTGGPSTGKSSLADRLRERGYTIKPEAAKQLIDQGIADGSVPLPWENLVGFERALHLFQRVQERNAAPGTFLDRSLIDIVAYCKAYGIALPPGLMKDAHEMPYGNAFILDPLPVFEKTSYRSEDIVEASRLASFFRPVYTALGFTTYNVPAFIGNGRTGRERINDAIDQRADYVLENLVAEEGKEIEIKARTKDIERVFHSLSSYPGTITRVNETDRYIPIDEGSLRVRRQVHPDGSVLYIETKKGPKENANLTVRTETERPVSAAEFENATYALEVTKDRALFKPHFSPGVNITVDDVKDLGHFVEVEGPTRHAVNHWAGQLLLPKTLWVAQSYEHLKKNAA